VVEDEMDQIVAALALSLLIFIKDRVIALGHIAYIRSKTCAFAYLGMIFRI
jgi:hypothetical protein